ncbi:MAG TPA: FAD-binding oxidoreductase [Candidatus Xenobia bacterium]
MKRRAFLATLCALAAYGASPWDDLRRLVPLITSDEPQYPGAARLFNPRLASRPAAIARPTTAEQIADCLAFCRAQAMPFAVRCGGHSYEGLSATDGLQIDVAEFNEVRFLSEHAVRLGAGHRLGAVYEALAPHVLGMAAGTCPTVGISGYTLGGGYGFTARQQGLAIDNLLAVEMVLASGQTVRATPRQHADLFWACRGGGGGSFGVATAFEFHLLPVPETSVFEVTWPFADLDEAMRRWQAWGPHAPDGLTSELIVHAKGQGDVKVTGLFLGPAGHLSRLVRRGLGRDGWVRSLPWLDAFKYFGGGNTRLSPPWKAKSDFLARPLEADGLDVLTHYLSMHGDRAGKVAFEAFGGAIARVAPDATAFWHRHAMACVQYAVYWKRTGDAAQAWLRDMHQAMRPFVTGGAYQNYCDLDLSDWGRAYYGQNFERLCAIKRKYDPQNVFRHAQSIPL